jgi:hypothetical protein
VPQEVEEPRRDRGREATGAGDDTSRIVPGHRPRDAIARRDAPPVAAFDAELLSDICSFGNAFPVLMPSSVFGLLEMNSQR